MNIDITVARGAAAAFNDYIIIIIIILIRHSMSSDHA
jgi:hypothetical protein